MTSSRAMGESFSVDKAFPAVHGHDHRAASRRGLRAQRLRLQHGS